MAVQKEFPMAALTAQPMVVTRDFETVQKMAVEMDMNLVASMEYRMDEPMAALKAVQKVVWKAALMALS